MKKLIVLLVSLICCIPVFAQQQSPLKPDSIIPFDANVRTGKLPNGLTYFIRKNDKPEHRAELRLVVNAGSVLETDSQQGLAHLTEHMCFNGTKEFPKSAIVDFLESSGMTFGADLNAYTGFDETVYMLQIPTDTPAVFNKGMEILEEWAHNVSFEDVEVDKERGVVIEEWRLGRGARERMMRKYYPVEFYNSRYANRLPIGKKEIVETAPYDTLKKFYKDWYRPDLMAVVVVGDVNVDEVENMIKKEFTPLTNPQPERPRVFFPVPDTKDLMVSICTDKEAPNTTVQLMFKEPLEGKKTVNDYRENLKRQIFCTMLNERYSELQQQADPPFAYAGSGYSDITRTKAAYNSFAIVKDGGIERGLKTLLDENYRVKQFGFTASELDRQKKEMLRYLERAYSERNKTESRSYVSEYINHFLSGDPSPGVEWEYKAWKELLPTITLDEVNRLAGKLITDGKNAVIVITAPQKEGVQVPTEEQVKQIFKDEQKVVLTPHTDEDIDKPLLSKEPISGKVVKETTIPQYNITEWTLSNGARVVLKPTDFKNDEILFSAYSFGGTSLYPDKDDISASVATEIVQQSGLGPYNAVELNKYMSDKVVRISPLISESSQDFSGSASPKDFETLLQMLYLYFTAPKKDSTGYESFMSRELSYLENNQNRPEAALSDTVSDVMHSYNYRYRPLTVQVLGEADLNRAYNIYKDRFADGGEFTYVFVGSFKPEEIKPLIEKYIGGLPTQHRKETFKDLGIVPPKGIVTKTVVKGTEPKSAVQLYFTGPFVYNRYNLNEVAALTRLVNIKLRETLREDMSGVYGVSVIPDLRHYPEQTYQMRISFGCAPENVNKLIAAALNVIDSIKQNGCNDKDLVKVKELSLKERETNLKENRFWLSLIASAYENNESITEINDYDRQINALTSDDFKRMAKQYFAMDNFDTFVLNPEK